ncbi:hypothetical protein CYMTET_53629 [Cymbomonas tetramitiformis]|uniref:Uncharacterized protein n=1 Tax=Cymbomonas tetramitiformis TaxID=36881 RepID=A0AAE0BGG8_9CHLO|nr:hypothetical protein CYMTET_53629 [Cymbomonas tetramitiformis]
MANIVPGSEDLIAAVKTNVQTEMGKTIFSGPGCQNSLREFCASDLMRKGVHSVTHNVKRRNEIFHIEIPLPRPTNPTEKLSAIEDFGASILTWAEPSQKEALKEFLTVNEAKYRVGSKRMRDMEEDAKKKTDVLSALSVEQGSALGPSQDWQTCGSFRSAIGFLSAYVCSRRSRKPIPYFEQS